MKIVFIAGPYFGDGDKSKIQGNQAGGAVLGTPEGIRHAEQYQIALANAGVGFFCPFNFVQD